MKRIHTIMVIALLMEPASSFAGFKLAKSMGRMQNFQEVQDVARTKNKPICFLYTDADSTCGLATQAALDAIDALDGRSVLVYVNSKSEFGLLPDVVKKALQSPESGTFIPKTVVVDSELHEVIALIPYATGKERKEGLSNARSAISSWQKTAKQPPAGSPGTASAETDSTTRTWTSASGKTIEGQFAQLQQDMVVLKKPDGTTVQIHISNLSPNDQMVARKMSAPPLQ